MPFALPQAAQMPCYQQQSMGHVDDSNNLPDYWASSPFGDPGVEVAFEVSSDDQDDGKGKDYEHPLANDEHHGPPAPVQQHTSTISEQRAEARETEAMLLEDRRVSTVTDGSNNTPAKDEHPPFVAPRAEVRALVSEGGQSSGEAFRVLRGWRRALVGEGLIRLVREEPK